VSKDRRRSKETFFEGFGTNGSLIPKVGDLPRNQWGEKKLREKREEMIANVSEITVIPFELKKGENPSRNVQKNVRSTEKGMHIWEGQNDVQKEQSIMLHKSSDTKMGLSARTATM